MDTRIDLTGLDKAEVLAALYNASRPLGMGFIHYDPAPMGKEEAADCLKQSTYFDYLKGRVMKIELGKDSFDPRLYDRDNGEGAAFRVIQELRHSGETNSELTQSIHKRSTEQSAEEAIERMHEETKREGNVVTLGLKDAEDVLGPKIDAIIEKNRQERG